MWLRSLILAIVFLIFGIGIFIFFEYRNQKDILHECSITVKAPRSSTWNYLIDTSYYKNWKTDYLASKLNSGRLNRLGSAYTYFWKSKDGEIQFSDHTIIRIKPYEFIEYDYVSNNQQGRLVFTVEDVSLEETYIKLVRKFRINGFRNHLSYLLDKTTYKNKDEADFKRLKSKIEASYLPNAGAINKKRIPAVRIPK